MNHLGWWFEEQIRKILLISMVLDQKPGNTWKLLFGV